MSLKKCSDCFEVKSLDLFYDNNKSKDGKQSKCISCCKKYYEENKENTKQKLVKDYEYIIKNRWKALNQRSCNGLYSNGNTIKTSYQMVSYHNKNITIDMKFDEFSIWMYSEKDTFDRISATGEIPCIDRIDDLKGYQIDNIQLISRHENFEKKYGKICKKYTKEELEKKKKYNKNQYMKSKS
jgi:hypothetical protein